jgi:hypothetical protein
MEFIYPEGATPLDPNEIEGLLLTHITTRSEIDRWEHDNITYYRFLLRMGLLSD